MRLIARLHVAVLIVSTALLLPSLGVAQQSRSIPRTPGNQDFFALTQSLFAAGDFEQSSCGAQRPDIEQCIRTCNRPGPQERNGCCCAIENATFFVGVRGGCRYSQQVQNFTVAFIYRSFPINSDMPFFDRTSCAFTAENANGESCTCSLQWEASAETLEMMSPIPSPSSTPSPVLSAPMSVPPIRTPEPTTTPEPTETPTVEPTVEPTIPPTIPPTTTPTIVTPPTAVSLTPQPTMITSEPTPVEEEIEPSPSLEDDDGSVCVDQSYLVDRGYSAEHLVHAGGVMSPVLCPQHADLPCASANHMVRYDGGSMSYRQLCERHAHMRCRADEMMVNSVFTHVWREVQHGDVQLTMFDSRYGELAQKALHSLLHKVRLVRKRWV